MYKTILFFIHFVFSWFNHFFFLHASFLITFLYQDVSSMVFMLMLCSHAVQFSIRISQWKLPKIYLVVRSMILTERHCLTKHSLLISQAMETFLVYNPPLILFHQRIRIGFVLHKGWNVLVILFLLDNYTLLFIHGWKVISLLVYITILCIV